MAGQQLVDVEELQKKLAAERASIAGWVDGRRDSAEAISQEHSHMVKELAGHSPLALQTTFVSVRRRTALR